MTDYSDEQIETLVSRLNFASLADYIPTVIARILGEAADALASLQRRNAKLAAEIANCGLSQTYVAHIEAENALLRKATRDVLALCDESPVDAHEANLQARILNVLRDA